MPTRPPPPATPNVESTATVWNEGKNFRAALVPPGLVWLAVWQRPDLTREQGAACAEEMVTLVKDLARHQRGLILDLRRATTTWGPRTNAALASMLASFETRGLPVRVLPADEPIQAIAIKALLAEAAPKLGAVATDLDTAARSLVAKKP